MAFECKNPYNSALQRGSRTRDVTAAKAFFRKALKRHGEPQSNYPGWLRGPPMRRKAAWA
jgi:hypothetical protein